MNCTIHIPAFKTCWTAYLFPNSMEASILLVLCLCFDSPAIIFIWGLKMTAWSQKKKIVSWNISIISQWKWIHDCTLFHSPIFSMPWLKKGAFLCLSSSTKSLRDEIENSWKIVSKVECLRFSWQMKVEWEGTWGPSSWLLHFIRQAV